MAILSKSRKICFIHITRTGGTTVRQLLGKEIEDLKIDGYKHETIKECLITNPEVSDYYKFSFVRQPYDWISSLYYYIKMPIVRHPDFNLIKSFSLYEFLEWLQDVGMRRTEGIGLYKTQSQYLFIKNKMMMNDIYRFEELCDDCDVSILRTIFNKFDLPCPMRIPVLNKSERPTSSIDSISIKEIKLINKLFSDDFKNFKYFKYE